MTFDIYDADRYFVGTFEPDPRIVKLLGDEWIAVAVRAVTGNRNPCCIVMNETATTYKGNPEFDAVETLEIRQDGTACEKRLINRRSVMRNRREMRPA